MGSGSDDLCSLALWVSLWVSSKAVSVSFNIRDSVVWLLWSTGVPALEFEK